MPGDGGEQMVLGLPRGAWHNVALELARANTGDATSTGYDGTVA